MKKFTKFLLLATSMILLFSCQKDNLVTNNKLKGQIVLPSGKVGKYFEDEIKENCSHIGLVTEYYNYNYSYSYDVLCKTKFNMNFELELPKTVSNSYLNKISNMEVFDYFAIDVSNPSAKISGMFFLEEDGFTLYGLDGDEPNVPFVYASDNILDMYAEEDINEFVMACVVYSDSKCKIKGNDEVDGSEMTFDVNLSKGWNTVYAKFSWGHNYDECSITSSKPKNYDMIWAPLIGWKKSANTVVAQLKARLAKFHLR